MHIIQQKLIALAEKQNLAGLTLRKIGELIGEPNSPQKIKHHLNKIMERGLLIMNRDEKKLRLASKGVDKKTNIISLPIIGAANCGEALTFADQKVEGYLKISLWVLGLNFKNRVKNSFVLRAVGDSMNRANINGKSIENGDYVVVEKTNFIPSNGDYVVSLIDGMANIKKFLFDKRNKQIVLMSESSVDIPPIYIHENDYSDYLICGKVVDVMKKPDELAAMRDASAQDILSDLGSISKEEVDYYKNL